MSLTTLRLPDGQTATVTISSSSITFTLPKNLSDSPLVWTLSIIPEPPSTTESASPVPSSPKRQCLPYFSSPTLQDDTLFISSTNTHDSPSVRQLALMLWISLYCYFHHPSPCPQTNPPTAASTPAAGKPVGDWRVSVVPRGIFTAPGVLEGLERMGLLFSENTAVGETDEKWDDLFISRRMFWQIPSQAFLYRVSRDTGYNLDDFSMTTPYVSPPLAYTTTNNIRHPMRPKPPRMGKVFYSRFIPTIGEYLSFRVASNSPNPVPHSGPRGPSPPKKNTPLGNLSDTQLIQKWMAKPRVSEFWGKYTDDFLPSALTSRNSFPVIGLWDGIPFGFFQIYWAREDILGELVGGEITGEYDRGLHVFIGEDWARGRVPYWLGGLAHWCFEMEGRTGSVVLEPRVDNWRFLKRLEENGFWRERMVTFKHKQSWLVRLRREMWEGPAV